MPRSLRAPAILAALITGAACTDPATAPLPVGPITVAVVSGDAQQGNPGEELPNALVVQVTDSRGHRVSGQLVNFVVVEGGGRMFAGASITDRQGHARDYWTLGMSGPQRVEVRAVDPTSGAKLTFGIFTATFPPPPDPDADGDGYTVGGGDCNDSNASINPGATEIPGDGIDQDCNGADAVPDAVHVSVLNGTSVSTCGSLLMPCISINGGIARALELGLSEVRIAYGTYNERVDVRGGVNLRGGYDPLFTTRDLSLYRAQVTGAAPFGGGIGVIHTVSFVNQVTAATVEGLIVAAPDQTAIGTGPGGNGLSSVAVVVSNNTATLTMSDVHVIAGRGANGLAGSSGANASASPPGAGTPGGNAVSSGSFCDETSFGGGGGGGTNPLASSGTAGGGGGRGGTKDTDCTAFSWDFGARPGVAGASGAANGVPSAQGGNGGATCSAGMNGQDGSVSDGAQGTGGSGFTLTGIFPVANYGTNGALGANGGGGGGGGGSGGCDDGIDSWGAGGGGGGAGGMRASSAGTGGRGGGASIGVLLASSIQTVLHNVSIDRAQGGNGGNGGNGGTGQPGSSGANGGFGDGGAQPGGRGGNGGRGGHSGAGGGGAGGMSVGILLVNGSAVTQTGTSPIAGGAGGAGGVGGSRPGGPAPNGTAGENANVKSIP